MFMLVKDGEFESPQEAAWLFSAGELPIDRARALADHWLNTGSESDALIDFYVKCIEERFYPTWRELSEPFEIALKSLGAKLFTAPQSRIRIAARHNALFVNGSIDRRTYLPLIENIYFEHLGRSDEFLDFLRSSGLAKLGDISFEFEDVWMSGERPELTETFHRLFDETAQQAHERITASGFSV